jgi:hypothetical protein
MGKYEIWFQDGHIMMEINARNNQEARKEFNRYISIKKKKDSQKN